MTTIAATQPAVLGAGTGESATVRRQQEPAGIRRTGRVPTVLHFIASVGGGGAEAMLMNLVTAMHGGPWRTVVVAVDGRAWPEQAAQLRLMANGYHDLESPAFLRRDTLSRLRMILRAEQPDVVQTWMHHADLVGGLVARLAGIRRVVWGIHCREIHRSPGDGEFKMALLRLALGMHSRWVPSQIVSCSAAAIDDHAGVLHYPRGKMVWIPNGIDTERFRPDGATGAAVRAELGIPSEAPLIGFVGRFHEMKRLDVLLHAAAELQRQAGDAWLLIAGGTGADLPAEARSALATLPHPDQVRFIPFSSAPERLYAAMDLFSLSSRTEACPMTVLEAMSCGVPCVTSDVGDCARLIGGAGCTVPPGNPSLLAAAWLELLRQPASARSALRRQARQRVQSQFTITRAAQEYEAVYARLIPSQITVHQN